MKKKLLDCYAFFKGHVRYFATDSKHVIFYANLMVNFSFVCLAYPKTLSWSKVYLACELFDSLFFIKVQGLKQF